MDREFIKRQKEIKAKMKILDDEVKKTLVELKEVDEFKASQLSDMMNNLNVTLKFSKISSLSDNEKNEILTKLDLMFKLALVSGRVIDNPHIKEKLKDL